LFVAQERKPSQKDAAALTHFVKEAEARFCSHFNPNDPGDLARQVVAALASIWNELDARMTIVVQREYDAFVRDPMELVLLRECIAQDAPPVAAEMVWLTLPSEPVPGITLFQCLLPESAQHLYLSRKSWGGGVKHAANSRRGGLVETMVVPSLSLSLALQAVDPSLQSIAGKLDALLKSLPDEGRRERYNW